MKATTIMKNKTSGSKDGDEGDSPSQLIDARIKEPVENAEIVREVLEGVQAGMKHGDPGAGFDSEAVAEDVEWIPTSRFPGPDIYRGRDGFTDFLHTWTDGFEDWSFSIERLVDAPDERVVVQILQSAIGKGSGTPVEMHLAQVYELKDGRVFRIRNFLDLGQALEAAGLSE